MKAISYFVALLYFLTCLPSLYKVTVPKQFMKGFYLLKAQKKLKHRIHNCCLPASGLS